MFKEELYEHVKPLIEKCNRCGFCRAVCPSLSELGWESTAPRGRMFLVGQVLSGEVPLTPEIVTRLEQCLLCRNCMAACPVGAKIDQVIMAFRQYVAQEKGIPTVKKLMLSALEHRGLCNLMAPLASVAERIPFKEIPGSGAVFRFNKNSRVLPMFGGRPLMSQVQKIEPEKPIKKVAFYVGCYINYIGINVGRSVLNVLSHNGVSVVIPPSQTCCGVPYFASGQLEKGALMIRQNIDSLEKANVDAIVYACGSCGTGLREWSTHPEVGQEYIEKALQLEGKTYEIGEYLIDHLGIKELPPYPKKTRVTYHDSCHMAVGSGVKEQPRRLLQMMDNIEYVEMPNATSCCGMGGLFSVTHYELSRKINEHKIANILSVEPQMVTSGCPGCNLHIMDGLHKAQSGVIPFHYIELVSTAYDCQTI
jgi:glycolate oxidase iron-sulfur subunit